jgi:DNA repair protein RadC
MVKLGRMVKKLKIAKISINKKNKIISWWHPGGKFLRLGPESCTDSELLAILIGTGIPGKTAEQIAEEILKTYQSFRGLANQPLEKLIGIKGLKKVKAVRIAAAFELARRIIGDL